MKQPLIMQNGLLQAAGGERLQFLRVNLGAPELITVDSKTILMTSTRHFLVKGDENKVNTILGGEEGDLLMLQGDVALVTGGNIARKKDLKADKIHLLIFTGGFWISW